MKRDIKGYNHGATGLGWFLVPNARCSDHAYESSEMNTRNDDHTSLL